MPTFRKKPVVIEAQHFTWETIHQVAEWCGGEVRRTRPLSVDGVVIGGARGIYIGTLEGEMRADVDDWIIKGVQGEFYPCKPSIFDATYEPWSSPRDADGMPIPGITGDTPRAAGRLAGEHTAQCGGVMCGGPHCPPGAG
jgi:hypothetical protein